MRLMEWDFLCLIFGYVFFVYHTITRTDMSKYRLDPNRIFRIHKRLSLHSRKTMRAVQLTGIVERGQLHGTLLRVGNPLGNRDKVMLDETQRQRLKDLSWSVTMRFKG